MKSPTIRLVQLPLSFCLSMIAFAAMPLATRAHSQEPEPAPAPAPAPGDGQDTVYLKVEFDGKPHTIVIRLNPAAAPATVSNFKNLVEEGFYDGLAIHRVIPDYLVQTGDPYSKDDSRKDVWGTGDTGFTVPPEIGLPHRRGSVGAARLTSSNPDKHSSGSQFYICLVDMPDLNRDYTVFGEVIEGLSSLDDIGSKPADSNDRPIRRIEIKSARLGPPGFMASIPNPANLIKNPFRKDSSKASSDSSAHSPADEPAGAEKEKSKLTRLIERIW